MKHAKFLGLGLLVAALAVPGCGPQASTSQGGAGGNATVQDTAKAPDHTHGTGPHGGVVFDLGKYHGEFTVEHPKQEATVYVLGEDEKTPTPIEAEKLELHIKDPAFDLELKPAPLEGEPKGKSSRFVGKHEKLGHEQEFEGTLLAVIDGKPSQGDFKEEPDKKK